MGDTGSLSLGGSLGAVGIITKHEIVLAITGGLFVLEAVSVMVQVISFKLTGKRIFRMAPIHHHFEKKGPTDPFVWYELAEVQGFSNNLIGLHRSRAEYFFLTGRFEAAIMQLREASKLAANFFEVSESIRTRMEEIYQTTEALKRMG